MCGVSSSTAGATSRSPSSTGRICRAWELEPIFQFLAALRLFYEAPNVLTKSFLPPTAFWFHELLRNILLFAIWIVRWLIAGINGVIFTGVLLVLVLEAIWHPAGELLNLPLKLEGHVLAYALVGILTALGLVCYWLAVRGEKDGFGLTEVWIATAVFAGVGVVLLELLMLAMPNWLPQRLVGYIPPLVNANFLVAIVWDVVAVVAILLWLLVCLKRTVLRTPVGAPPLARISGALALGIVQALVWKVAVPAFGVVSIDAFFGGEGGALNGERQRMMAVGVLNSLLIGGAAIWCILLLNIGSWGRWVLPVKLETWANWVPRVAVSWVLVSALALAAVANLYLHYTSLAAWLTWVPIGSEYYREWCKSAVLSECVAGSSLLKLVVVVVAMLVLGLFVTGILQNIFKGVLHFGRDIVDHQYQPANAFARRQAARRGRGGQVWPRRERIEQRLDVLMRRAVASEKFDRIIFLTHSQGSIIAHDFMRWCSEHARAIVGAAVDVHVVTLGSPITHLYQHYFEEYSSAGADTSWLPRNLASWTNMWRIDDPIGRANEIGEKGFVDNRPLEPGGHDDYWKQPEVCDLIVDLIERPFLLAGRTAGADQLSLALEARRAVASGARAAAG